jgi:hypothetical protein
MKCERHGLVVGPDGRCALCHRGDRAETRHTDRRIHRGLRVLIAILAGVATYALLMALLDTRRPAAREQRVGDARID